MPHPGPALLPAQPFRTDLAYYRDRATGLVSVHATGERNALREIRRLHPAFAGADEPTIRNATFTQSDAELVLARDHGFKDWPSFAAHIETLARRPAPFRDAFNAIETDDLPKLVALLRQTPTLANARGTNGNRLLTLAVTMCRTAHVAHLLDAGADPDQPNTKGWTALHAAAYAGPDSDSTLWLPILNLLLAAGASADMEAYGDGGTPLAVALFWGHTALAERLAEDAITPANLRIAAALGRQDLLATCFTPAGALTEAAAQHREFHRPHSGFPPWQPTNNPQEVLDEALTWAARSGRTAAMDLLLAHGANIDSEPYNGAALHWAIAREQPQAATWLLDHGADINRRANFGGARSVTPLHIAAAWRGSPTGARLLLARGADRTLTEPQYNATPAGWAQYFNHPDIEAMCRPS